MRTEIRKLGCTLALLGLLSACGGGGGGGTGSTGSSGSSGGSAGGTDAATALAFNTTNAGRVAGYPLWASELMLRIGQAVGEEVAAAAKQSRATITTVNCSTGTFQRSWADKDGDDRLSAGDEITLDFSACNREPLARSAQGRMTVLLDSLAGSGDFVARVVLPAPGMVLAPVVGAPGPTDFRVSGQMRVTLSRSELRHALILGGGSDDALAFDFPGAPFAADRITAFRLDKTHRWDEARTLLDIRMRYDSPELGGAFDVSMPMPLKSWLDELPEPGPQQGSFAMRGRGGDLVSLTIGGANRGPSDLSVSMDLAGDGSVEARGEGTWEGIGLVSGVFFADYTPGGRGNTYGYNATELSLRRAFIGGSVLPVDTAFSLQFTRPVVGASTWRWRLVDQGRLDQMPTTGAEVPMQVELQGAVIKLKPTQPLRYSRRYELLVDTGEPTANGQQMRATTGGVLSIYGGSLGAFTTPNILNPQSTLAGHLTVMADTPVQAEGVLPMGGAPADLRYQWTQIGGTPLVIQSPNQRSTLIGLGAGVIGVGAVSHRAADRERGWRRQQRKRRLRAAHGGRHQRQLGQPVARAHEPGGLVHPTQGALERPSRRRADGRPAGRPAEPVVCGSGRPDASQWQLEPGTRQCRWPAPAARNLCQCLQHGLVRAPRRCADAGPEGRPDLAVVRERRVRHP